MQRNANGHVLYRKTEWDYPLIERGEGVYLYDQNGKKYIDATGGPMLINIGHGVSEIAEAISEQAKRIEYVHGTQFTTQSIEEYAKEFAEVLPGDIDKIYVLSGGSEAMEAAFKLACQYQGYRGNPCKYRAVGRWHSFHGSTLATLSLGGRPKERKFYEPLIYNFPHIAPCYCYRCPFDKTYPNCEVQCARDLERTIKLEKPETIAAFVAETVSGTSLGATVPPKEYYPTIREICDKYDILFIADEVMCGMGRTGQWFAIEHWNVVPDIIITGKGASGGYLPIGVMATTQKVLNPLIESGASFLHGHSYTNTPMTAACALAVIRYLKKHALIERNKERGEYLGKKLEAFYKFPFVGDIRGLGGFRAIEFVQDKGTKTPFPMNVKFAENVYKKMFDKGVVTYMGTGCADGIEGDILMISPPFIITEQEIDQVIDALWKSLKEMEQELNYR